MGIEKRDETPPHALDKIKRDTPEGVWGKKNTKL